MGREATNFPSYFYYSIGGKNEKDILGLYSIYSAFSYNM